MIFSASSFRDLITDVPLWPDLTRLLAKSVCQVTDHSIECRIYMHFTIEPLVSIIQYGTQISIFIFIRLQFLVTQQKAQFCLLNFFFFFLCLDKKLLEIWLSDYRKKSQQKNVCLEWLIRGFKARNRVIFSLCSSISSFFSQLLERIEIYDKKLW